MRYGVIERASYELCVIVSLKDALRCREIYVAGARRWRNPEEDLPTDFEDNRDVHYENLPQTTPPGPAARHPLRDAAEPARRPQRGTGCRADPWKPPSGARGRPSDSHSEQEWAAHRDACCCMVLR
jgi:hypothetical protein